MTSHAAGQSTRPAIPKTTPPRIAKSTTPLTRLFTKNDRARISAFIVQESQRMRSENRPLVLHSRPWPWANGNGIDSLRCTTGCQGLAALPDVLKTGARMLKLGVRVRNQLRRRDEVVKMPAD